ncbi:hypothetical protein ACU686_44335 [Yinghuangia aomiensis]
MLFRLRVSLPDRPGSLARVTQSLGTAGGRRPPDDRAGAPDRPRRRRGSPCPGRASARWPGWSRAWNHCRACASKAAGRPARCPAPRPNSTSSARSPGTRAARSPPWSTPPPRSSTPPGPSPPAAPESCAVVHSSWQAPAVPHLPLVAPLRPLALELRHPRHLRRRSAHRASWLTLFVVRTDGPNFHPTELERLGRLVDVVLGVLGTRTSAKAGRTTGGN